MLVFYIDDKLKKLTNKQRQLFKLANVYLSKLQKQNFIYDINIVDNQKIKKLNNQYRHINKITDVLSFAMHDAKQPKTELLGEIFINYQQAQKQATVSVDYEITLLFIHGVLHLLGYDHKNKTNENEMFLMQNKIIKQLNLVK
ncbi:MAG: rRNA maturation RNase YbeY [Mycoplasmataceae bacterium]|jgi:probable rRNA maturation factor|nr:rRNA maturation RNase YbeY [Mycoplasmataceae bacterium]